MPLGDPLAVNLNHGHELTVGELQLMGGIDVNNRKLTPRRDAFENALRIVAQRAAGAGIKIDLH